MKRKSHIFFILFLTTLLAASILQAHTVNYVVQQKGIAVRVFYSADDPASYSQFEVFGPGDTLPHQTGRTDKNGFVSFVPDRQGVWKVKVLGESSHGYHGATIEVKVNKELDFESFKKPLAATYSKLITGISLIIGIFGLYALLASRKKRPSKTNERES
jgi:nickel transport protein